MCPEVAGPAAHATTQVFPGAWAQWSQRPTTGLTESPGRPYLAQGQYFAHLCSNSSPFIAAFPFFPSEVEFVTEYTVELKAPMNLSSSFI